MQSNKPFFGTKNRSKLINGIIRPVIDNLLLVGLLLLLIKIINVIGFDRNSEGNQSNLNYHQWVFSLLAIGYLIRSVICIGFKNFRSAFCNAGFSTLTDGIYDYRIRGIYPILYVLSFLIILGGIGFPILLNLYTFVKYKFFNIVSIIRFGRKKDSIPMMINVNSRLVIYTTLFLIIVGTVFFFIFESDYTLKGMDLSGKIAHSFFGSVTPRTAGYNSVDMRGLSIATVVLTIFLMWVGASPVSTGGGIKTSTFAIAVLNALRIARVKNHIEFHKREFHERSVDRAFAIIILSIVILGCSSLIMYLIEPDKGALNILFECVSAFGTVGLSLGITPRLADSSKLLLILLMYAGRMGILTLLFAIFRKTKTSVYRYPKENIVIT